MPCPPAFNPTYSTFLSVSGSAMYPTGSDLRTGAAVYDISLGGVMVYNGSAWAGLPLGVIASHTLTTAFATSATHTTAQDEGLTVTFTEIATRKYKITIVVNPYAPGGANGLEYLLLRNGVNIRNFDITTEAISTGFSHSITYTHYISSATGGAATWKMQVRALNNNTSVSSHGAATFPRQLLIEDMGV